MFNRLGNGTPISVAIFSVAWRVEVVKEKWYHGWDYVQYTHTWLVQFAVHSHCSSFLWGTTNMTWDLAGGGSSEDCM